MCEVCGWMPHAYVWLLYARRVVLVTDDPGALVGAGIVGDYPLPDEGGWGEAGKVAEAKAKELGYTVDFDSMVFEDDDDGLYIDYGEADDKGEEYEDD
jgi:hypothetical protein